MKLRSAVPTAVILRQCFAEHTSFVAVTALFVPDLRSGEISFCLYSCLENFRSWLRHCRRLLLHFLSCRNA